MASHSTYIHELRELITSSTAASAGSAPGSEHLEVKLREVLPNLLRDYVIPSPKASKRELREVIALLRLVAFTALKFPGVFYNGRAADVISVIGRILPFLAEPDFRSSHDLIFAAVWNLLSILRTGDREAYRQFFLDAMVAVEDVLYVASIHDESPGGVPPGRCVVKCLSGSFSDILDSPGPYSELPASCQPKDGPGVLVDLTGVARWRPFATSLIKLVNKCLADGTLYVDGLVNMSFISAACSILCYGDGSLHKVCFDFARIVATVMTAEILPLENIIRSITCILSQDVTELSDIRDADYDFSMGACLRALHSSCPGYVVESTAVDIVNVLQRAVKTSKSAELQVAMYTAYKRIIELCSAQVWKPEILLKLLCLPKPCSKLIECIRMVISKFGQNFFTLDDDNIQSSPQARSEIIDLPKVGQKRISQNEETSFAKRQKLTESGVSAGIGFKLKEECGYALRQSFNSLIKCLSPDNYETYPLDPETEIIDLPKVGQKRISQNEETSFAKRQKLTESGVSAGIGFKLKEECGYALRQSFNPLIKCLSPDNYETYPLDPETAIEVTSLLCLSLCVYPKTSLFTRVSKQVLSWISWIHKQKTQRNMLSFDAPLYFEALHTVMLLQFSLPGHTKLIEDESQLIDDGTHFVRPIYADLIDMLKLIWDDGHVVTQTSSDDKIKILLMQAIAKVGSKLNAGCDLEVLDLAIHNGTAEIQNESIMSLPIIVLYSGPMMLGAMFRKLESLSALGLQTVGKSMAFSLGFLCCLNGMTDYTDNVGNHCKLFLDKHSEQPVSTLDLLLRGFWCPQCDIRSRVVHNEDQISIMDTAMLCVENMDFNINISKAHTLFFKFLYAETSEESIVSCVEVLPRILRHSSRHVLLETRTQWVQCFEFLLLHEMKAVREAFSGVVCCFLENNVMDILFSDGLRMDGGTKELQFMDKIKCAFTEAEDSHILLTLLESIGTIMKVSDFLGEVFFCSFMLLIGQLDNHNSIIRMTALRLIHRCCAYCFKGGLDIFLLKYSHARDNLYNYLSSRLVTHPIIIKGFAEDVLGINTKELIERMVPSVIPKLIVSHPNNNDAIITLRELASHLNTEVVTLIVNHLPKVLCFALFYEDGQHLPSVLQFYKNETATDSKEIFAAALPTLLDEIVCFPGESGQIETDIRTEKISPTIQNIARILTGNDSLPEFLRDDFVRLLNSIDKKMLHSDDMKLQKQALQRIRKLVEIMGPYLSTHTPKIMVLLTFAIDKEGLQMDGLDVLHFFIKRLAEVSPNSIKYVMSQVVAAFIPSLERCKGCPSAHLSKIVEILEELVKNNSLLKQHIRELPLLPSLPSLSEVNKVIQEARGLMTLQDHLKDAVNGLNHESLNVRYMVACELSKLFNARREDMTALIIGEDIAGLDVISSLIMALLRGCAEQSRTNVGQRLKMVCADCLGALGAVDPAKLKVNSCERFKIECSDDDLIFELIHKHLARAFRAAADTTVQDSAALAIQELLKLAGCQPSSSDDNLRESNCYEMSNRGQKLWGRFSNYVKEIIAPCLTSRFHLPNPTDSASVGPIYRPQMSFRRWIYYWIRRLTSHATGSRSGIFSACRGILRHDMPTAVYLLPYLVLNVVCYGTPEARQSITEEILCVLNAAASESSGAAVHGITGGQSEVCIQAIFTLLDNLGQWVDDLKQEIALSQFIMAGKHGGKLKDGTYSDYEQNQLLVQCSNVAELLAAIPKVTLARASLRCQAHARALMYFESHVQENSGSSNPAAAGSGTFSDDDISFLMEIYGGLDEPDGLLGLANLRKSSSLQDQLIINEKAGNWAEVLTLCEQALQMQPTSVHRQSDVLNCLLNKCHLQAMIAHVDGLVCSIPQYKNTWCMQGVQAAWRLGRWDLMDEYLIGADKGLVFSSSEKNASFDMDLAKIFKAMMIKDKFLFDEKIFQSKQALLVPLAAAGMDSYMRAYPYVVKLHMLRELEDFNALLGDESFIDKSFSADDPNFLKLAKDWENRLRCTQPSLWTREPLLALRRVVFSQSHMHAQVGNCWLQYAKLCRLAGHYETAHLAILEADASGAPNAHMEKAKYLWNIRKFDSAIAELQQTLLNMPGEILGSAVLSSLCSLSLALPNAPISATQASKENPDVSKALLLYTRWIHYTGQKQSADIKSLYSRVTELRPKWEKGFFCMAKFVDDLLIDARKRQEDAKFACKVGPVSSSSVSRATEEKEKPWWVSLPPVLMCYAKSLLKGHKNLFQALPRMLTLWFEFGSIYTRDGSSSDQHMKEIHGRVLSLIRGCLKDLPTYQWLTVLSQLISRICHQNADVVRLVKYIIMSVLREYPQQALWMMAAVSKSTVPARRDAAAEILQSAKKGCRRGSQNSALFIQFPTLIDHLIRLCTHPGNSAQPKAPKANTINISTEFSSLKRMMPLGIILPVQQALTVTLPSYDSNMPDQSGFHPFSVSEHPTIAGIADEAEILASLQKPKKVVFFGSDGVARTFLCKPKDDLRKDSRMMEFNAMINRLLSKVPESRRRKLYIRTFAVVPLTEDCGMIEWVPNTRGLRHILQDIYITHGKYDRMKNSQIKKIYDACHGKIPEDEMLKEKILPMFPPVFHKWFLTTFSEPAAWFRARVAYAHTTAVWSMVGHIVGLGDRHGENILFDSTTGDCVHVDFSCLFDRGLLLDKPEVVPFRLTQNMIDGLGIAGYEGIFLKVCEITLSVLRTHKETLMTVLETFIHDPLVEWTKTNKSGGGEVQNPHAQRAITNIKARLQGVVVGVKASPSLPLSVEGQARRLIAEAVSLSNLGKMYIWWMPWF